MWLIRDCLTVWFAERLDGRVYSGSPLGVSQRFRAQDAPSKLSPTSLLSNPHGLSLVSGSESLSQKPNITSVSTFSSLYLLQSSVYSVSWAFLFYSVLIEVFSPISFPPSYCRAVMIYVLYSSHPHPSSLPPHLGQVWKSLTWHSLTHSPSPVFSL